MTNMSTPTVPISETSHQLLQALARQTGQTATAVLDQALEAYRRKVFFDELNAGYAALRADSAAWAEFEAERKAWDATLMDGLDANEHWTGDGRCLTQPDEKS
jgi:predicted transcriptional regulator